MKENKIMKVGTTVKIERKEGNEWTSQGEGIITSFTHPDGAYVQNKPFSSDKFGPEWFPFDSPRLRISPVFKKQ